MTDKPGGILVVLDGSETSEHALDRAIERAADRGWSVTCLAIVPPRLWRARQGQFQMSPETYDEAFARELAEQGRDRCTKHGVSARALVRSGPPAIQIVEEANAGYDLVILGERSNRTGAPTLASIVRHRLPVPLEVERDR